MSPPILRIRAKAIDNDPMLRLQLDLLAENVVGNPAIGQPRSAETNQSEWLLAAPCSMTRCRCGAPAPHVGRLFRMLNSDWLKVIVGIRRIHSSCSAIC